MAAGTTYWKMAAQSYTRPRIVPQNYEVDGLGRIVEPGFYPYPGTSSGPPHWIRVTEAEFVDWRIYELTLILAGEPVVWDTGDLPVQELTEDERAVLEAELAFRIENQT